MTQARIWANYPITLPPPCAESYNVISPSDDIKIERSRQMVHVLWYCTTASTFKVLSIIDTCTVKYK